MRRSKQWVRLHHGVYVDRLTLDEAAGPEERHRLIAAATLLALPGDVALFGPSAAVAWGLPCDRSLLHTVHLVRPRGRDSRALRRRISAVDRLPPAVVHVLDVGDEDVTDVSGLLAVGRDLAATTTAMASDGDWAVATLDGLAWRDATAVDRLRELSTRWPRLAGAGVLTAALPHVRTGAQTPVETLSRLRLIRAGLPEPELQVPITDADGLAGIVDMLFSHLRVIGEADGALKYTDREVLMREKRREDRLRGAGYGVVRWGWREASGSMRAVAERIWRAGGLAQAG